MTNPSTEELGIDRWMIKELVIMDTTTGEPFVMTPSEGLAKRLENVLNGKGES